MSGLLVLPPVQQKAIVLEASMVTAIGAFSFAPSAKRPRLEGDLRRGFRTVPYRLGERGRREDTARLGSLHYARRPERGCSHRVALLTSPCGRSGCGGGACSQVSQIPASWRGCRLIPWPDTCFRPIPRCPCQGPIRSGTLLPGKAQARAACARQYTGKIPSCYGNSHAVIAATDSQSGHLLGGVGPPQDPS